MAVAYGTIAIVPKGVWNAGTEYNVGNLVELDGSSYVAKAKPPVGTLPTDTNYWQVSAMGTSKATTDNPGVVKPDGVTTTVDENAALSVKTAQQNAVGVVKGSAGIHVGADGSLDVNTDFEQAAILANIIVGEAIVQVLGKVSKAIATTMNLDQNALLKNMLTGIDVNDANKVPNAAFIHTLVERIGMGTDLGYGFTNLTAAVNSVKKQADEQNSNFVLEHFMLTPNTTYVKEFTYNAYRLGSLVIIGFTIVPQNTHNAWVDVATANMQFKIAVPFSLISFGDTPVVRDGNVSGNKIVSWLGDDENSNNRRYSAHFIGVIQR